MAWISVHQQIRDHRKTRKLFRALNISRAEAIGTLTLIWTWAIDNCDQEGELLSVTKDDIAEAAYWKKDPELLYKALVEAGWIDEVDGKIYLHDWADFNKPFYDYIARKERDKARKRQSNSAGNSTGNSTEIPQETPQEFHDSPSPSPSPSPEHISRKSAFTPPSLDEVRQYCLERNNNVDPEKWYDFYASKGWMVGKNKMKDWKAAVRTWERREDEDKLKPKGKGPGPGDGGGKVKPGKYEEFYLS